MPATTFPAFRPAIFLLFIVTGIAAAKGAETNNAAKPLRPFYIIGHGADTLAEAKAYLDAGVSGLEVDVDTLPGQSNALCIAHGPDLGTGPGKADSPPLADYLKALHALARSHTNFCLVYFDCKHLIATPEGGAILLHDIQTYLIGSGDDEIDLNALISVGTMQDRAIFSNITGRLGPHEGLMVDGDPRPAEVSAFFESSNVQNQAYSDGVVPFSTCLSHFSVWFAVKKACRLRDQDHQICFVTTWTINNPRLITKFIKMGVDGILVDRTFHWYNFSWENLGDGLRSIKHIVQRKGAVLGIRLANRDDNPFTIHKPVQSSPSASRQREMNKPQPTKPHIKET